MSKFIDAKKQFVYESKRLKALKDFEILDTPPEQILEEMTWLASQICETPVAMISLVDENRQWFKSRVGTDVTETPRDIAFCNHAIQEANTMIVEDALMDLRFKENPLVLQNPKIRF